MRQLSSNALMLVRGLAATAAVTLLTLAGVTALCTAAHADESHVFAGSFAGAGEHALSDPRGVAIDQSTGDVYVVDSGNDRVEVFSSSGTLLSAFGEKGSGDGEFKEPTEIAVDNSGDTSGDVYVVDAGNQRVEAFNAKGEYQSQITYAEIEAVNVRTVSDVDVAVDSSGDLWLVVTNNQAVDEVPAGGGTLEYKWSVNRAVNSGLVVAPNGDLWWANGSGATHLSASGEPLEGVGFDEEPEVKGLAVNSTNEDIYLDRGSVVAHFAAPTSSSEPPTDTFGSSGPDALEAGAGIAIDAASGAVYVADSARNQVDTFAAVIEPSLQLEAATGVERTAAMLHGAVNPSGLPVSECEFEYGTSKSSLSERAACSPAPGSGQAYVAVSAALSGLQPQTTYYYRLSAADANGVNQGQQVDSFTTAPAVDALSTGPAQEVTDDAVKLTGSLSPDGVDVHYHFQYGTSEAYGSTSPEVDAGSGGAKCAPPGGPECSPVAAEAELAGLSPNTTYHYRLVGVDSYGTTYGKDATFLTPGPPGVDRLSAEVAQEDKAGQTTATLQATITPDGRATTYRFEYGETSSYGNSVPSPAGALGSGEAPVAVPAAALSGLKVGTTYHYRVVAENEYGRTAGPDETFATLPAALVEASVTDVTSTSAILQADVNPLGTATTCTFEYLTQAGFQARGWAGSTVQACAAPLGAGEAALATSVALTGLAPQTEYRYRLIAENALGAAESAEQTFITQGAGHFQLPDERQWEMVSPPDKQGAGLIAPDKSDDGGAVIQAAANGDAFTFVATAPTEAGVLSNPNGVQVFAARGAGGWSAHDITLPHTTTAPTGNTVGNEFHFFSEDLASAIVQPFGQFDPAISPEASEQTAFLADVFQGGDPGAACQSGCYTPLVTGRAPYADVPPGTAFGEFGPGIGRQEEGTHCPPNVMCGPIFADATTDARHVLLRSSTQLTSTPAPTISDPGRQENLYEWNAGLAPGEQLQLVSILPESEGGVAIGEAQPGAGENSERNAISANGSRVFWSSEGALYMRDLADGRTLRLDVPQAGCATCGQGNPGAVFQLATADGSRVFFKDSQRLTADAGESQTGGATETEETDLYECAIVEAAGQPRCQLSDLTPKDAAGEGALVKGAVIGAGEEGSWLYFVASGVLENHGVSVAGAVPGGPNLYVRHDGVTGLVAVLSDEDTVDWGGNGGPGDDLESMAAHVSPDGRWLAFMSSRGLTGNDTSDALRGDSDEQVYLYDAGNGALSCASCDPTGARPLGVAYKSDAGAEPSSPLVMGAGWEDSTMLAAVLPGWTAFRGGSSVYQPRALSDSGRLFFDSRDALVPNDVNGTWDVYEYEPEGVGGPSSPCSAQAQNGGEVFRPARSFAVERRPGQEGAGCVALISSGESSEESAFLDASESGGDVFFLTASRLAPQDYDHSFDVYDAHECTAASPCLPEPSPQPPACTTAESCRSAPAPQPEVFGSPSSQTFSGRGNLSPQVAAATPKSKKTAKAKKATRAQLRARALRACRGRRAKRTRAACELRAKRKYPVKQTSKRRR